MVHCKTRIYKVGAVGTNKKQKNRAKNRRKPQNRKKFRPKPKTEIKVLSHAALVVFRISLSVIDTVLPHKSENVRPHSSNSIENGTP